MLDTLCLRPFIEKARYKIQADDAVWEVDVFHGDIAGLVVAEIELCDETQLFARPDWLGVEVSDDPRYFNSALVKNPFN